MDLRDLYQELILDHAKRPRNFGALASANRSAEGINPLCGDRIKLELQVANDVIEEIHFQGVGCAISTASASLLTEALKGKSLSFALDLFEKFQAMVTTCPVGSEPATEAGDEELGKLAALRGVCEFPARVKCATLAWHALAAALKDGKGQVTTERGSGYA